MSDPRVTMVPMSSPIRTVHTTYALDCPDAPALAAFYARLLGWEVDRDETSAAETWIDVVPPEGHRAPFAIACQQVESYTPPTWPEGPVAQQAHVDFHVEDLEGSAELAEQAGATRHDYQPGRDFIVFLDPAGHPFCLCRASTLES